MPAATFPTVLGDFGCDIICHTCRENSPRTRAITLGSKPPLVTRIARTGLGKRLGCPIFLTKYLDVSLCIRPDVMKRYVMGQFLFPGNIDFASMTRAHFHVVFMKGWCVYSWSAVKLIWWIDQVKLIFNAEVLVWSSTDACSQASRLCPLFLNKLLFPPSLMSRYSSFHTRNPST